MGTKRSDSLFPELVLKYKYLKTVLVFLSKDGERTGTFDRYYRTNWILSVRLTDLEAGMRRVSTREVSASPRIHNRRPPDSTHTWRNSFRTVLFRDRRPDDGAGLRTSLLEEALLEVLSGGAVVRDLIALRVVVSREIAMEVNGCRGRLI